MEPSEFTSLLNEQFSEVNKQNLLEQCLAIGERSKKSRDRANASVISKIGHDLQWNGITFLCCNGAASSQYFTAGIKLHHEALMGWKYDGQTKMVTVSMYHAPGHENIDLSQIAKAQGGGGHKGACGFQTTLQTMAEILK